MLGNSGLFHCSNAYYLTRNLCATRWLKQVQPNGTTEQFRVYWDGLTAVQREQYQLDAERLQQDGQWTKQSDVAVCNGTLF